MKYLLFLLLSLPASAQVGNTALGRWIVTDRCANHECMTWWQWYCDTAELRPMLTLTGGLITGSFPTLSSDSVVLVGPSWTRVRTSSYAKTDSYVKHTGMDKKEHRWRTYTDSAHKSMIDTSWHEYPQIGASKNPAAILEWFRDDQLHCNVVSRNDGTGMCFLDSARKQTPCKSIEACMALYYRIKYPQSYIK